MLNRRAYSDAAIDEIIRVSGALPKGKVTYRGHHFAFGLWCRIIIKGDYFDREVPFFDAMVTDKSKIQEEMISRHMALQFHLENAAWDYLSSGYKPKRPSDWKNRYSKIRKACEDVIEIIEAENNEGPDAELFSKGFFSGTNDKFIYETVGNAYKAIRILHNEAIKLEDLQKNRLLPREDRHSSDLRLHRLAAALCIIWRDILGNEIKASVNPNDNNKGGPLIRFLQEATKPLGPERTPSQWRTTVDKLKSDYKSLLIYS